MTNQRLIDLVRTEAAANRDFARRIAEMISDLEQQDAQSLYMRRIAANS